MIYFVAYLLTARESEGKNIYFNYTRDVTAFVLPSEFYEKNFHNRNYSYSTGVHMEFYRVFHLKTTCPEVKAD